MELILNARKRERSMLLDTLVVLPSFAPERGRIQAGAPANQSSSKVRSSKSSPTPDRMNVKNLDELAAVIVPWWADILVSFSNAKLCKLSAYAIRQTPNATSKSLSGSVH